MKTLRLFTLMLAMVTIFAGCKKEPHYRIGVSQCSSDAWRNKINEEIDREMIFHQDGEVEIRSAEDDNARQIADIQYFIDNKFDAIIVAPNEAAAITPIVEKAYKKGIPVIIFDRNVNGHCFNAFQGGDNIGLGYQAAKYGATLVPPGSKVIEIYGRKGSTPTIDRSAGFARYLKEKGGMEVIGSGYGNWRAEDATRIADSLLRLHPDVDLIYAHNDNMAIAASKVARRMGIKPKVIGIDAAPEIGIKAVADSVIDATFIYPTEGHRLIRTAYSILRNEPVDTMLILPATSPVDYRNADNLLMLNGSLKEETSKIQKLRLRTNEYLKQHTLQTMVVYGLIVIIALGCGFVFLLLKEYHERKKHQKELEESNHLLEAERDKQKELNIRLQEATQSKLVFFTNVSHDLRTPLTLIAEPVEQLAKAKNLTPAQHELMLLARKNVKILRRLINQILDFRKFENGKLEFCPVETDFRAAALGWLKSFGAVCRSKDLRLKIDMPGDSDFHLAIDIEKMERVIFNLMSNAVKYSEPNGVITFRARIDGDRLNFSVRNSGKGIAPEEIGNIFERFYQSANTRPFGTGIGLALVKAFVELHEGAIEASSVPGKETCFNVSIPVAHTDSDCLDAGVNIDEKEVSDELSAVEDLDNILPDAQERDSDKPLCLVVDDHPDMITLIAGLLGDEYSIISASDGVEGFRKAVKYVPDMIISDVMMPNSDGFEMCRKVKEEISTSHIPVLLLTACSLDEQRAQGYECGADGYLSKPFNATVLKANCRSLLDNRKRIRKLWYESGGRPSDAEKTPLRPSLPETDIDSEFYARFVSIFNEKMSDSELSVEQLAADMGLGRSQFYRKIKALTNYSPVELVRRLRLQHARTLLMSTERTISEIAYEVGFSTPAYFTKCYRDAYGQTPKDLRDSMRR